MDFVICNRIIALLERIAVAVEKTKELSDADTNAPKPPFRNGTREYANAMHWARSVGLRDTRMIKALAKAGISSFDDVTVDNLAGIKHCGAITTKKLLTWAGKESNANLPKPDR